VLFAVNIYAEEFKFANVAASKSAEDSLPAVITEEFVRYDIAALWYSIYQRIQTLSKAVSKS
jgi:hypothetical protein